MEMPVGYSEVYKQNQKMRVLMPKWGSMVKSALPRETELERSKEKKLDRKSLRGDLQDNAKKKY